MLVFKIICYTVCFFSGFCIIWSMVGYNMSLIIISKFKHINDVIKTDIKPTVTVMVVAHNEEEVILDKLKNLINNDYPKDKIKYLIASDNSDDGTNNIVSQFIANNSDYDIRLYTSKKHMGKTNAQNEAQELVDTEILIMTDANAMFDKRAISELVSSFSDKNIAYVCGALIYTNEGNATSDSESEYWNGELKTRLIESKIKTITAGNGAIYACRNKDYIKIPPIECHDSSMPYIYGKSGKRAIFNEKAIAYEKAGETSEDEYRRKVRMNRVILMHIKNGIKVLNVFKYGWFSYFYFGHRTSRYLLWLNHLLVFLSSLALAILSGWFWKVLVILQILFYIVGYVGKYINNRLIHMVYYYCLTIAAQWNGVFNVLTGSAKPTWKSAKSTR